MQPTLESWVKRWIKNEGDYPDGILQEVRSAQNDFRELLLALADKVLPPNSVRH